MLLDVAFLIECLRSEYWDWSFGALADLFRILDLVEEGSDARQATRHFRASSGLLCVVFADAHDLAPTAFEFPFIVPSLPGVSAAEMLQQFVGLVRIPIETILGPSSASLSWDVGSSTLALEARPGQQGAPDVLALVVRKHPLADEAVSLLQRP